MAEPLSWTFTTGAPTAAISNGITFVTDRAGVANVWSMNADGTGQRQVSAELEPVLDYAVAPDGSSLVVSDGRRLVYQRADGSERRVLTDDGTSSSIRPTAPDGQRVAFARADAETGSRARAVGVAGRRRRRDADRPPRGDRRGPSAVARSVGRAGAARAALRAGRPGAGLRRSRGLGRHPRAARRAADARAVRRRRPRRSGCRTRPACCSPGPRARATIRTRPRGAGRAPRRRPGGRGPSPLALGHLGRRAPLRRRGGGARRRRRRPIAYADAAAGCGSRTARTWRRTAPR